MQMRRREILVFAAITALIGIAYANVMNGEFMADDITYLVNNPLLGSAEFITATPMTIGKALVNHVTYVLFGLSRQAFHAVNIILHTATTLMLYVIIRRLAGKGVAAGSALIYGVHPMLAESVSWIGGGGYVQYSLFFLISLWFYMTKNGSLMRYAWSILFFILMLSTSEKSIPLAAMFLVYEASFGSIRKRWKQIVPYFVLSGIWLILLFRVFDYADTRIASLQSDYYQPQGYYNPTVQIPMAIAGYLKLAFWPSELSLYQSDLASTGFMLLMKRVVFLIYVLGTILACFKDRFVFFWLMLLPVSLSPSLTPLPVAWVVAERYAYLGASGIITATAYLSLMILKKIRLNRLAPLLLAAILIALSTRTIIRNNDWKTWDAMVLSLAKTAKSDPKTHNNLGDYYGRQGDTEAAIASFRQAITLNPRYADAYHNLATAYLNDGRTTDAIEAYSKALEIKPDIWQSHMILGILYLQQGDMEKMSFHGAIAYQLMPQNTTVRALMGIIAVDQGNSAEGKAIIETVLKEDPGNRIAHYALSLMNGASE